MVNVNPSHPHCGPFNKIGRRARNRIDGICRKHDIAYGRYGWKAYFKYNKADEEFVNEMSKQPGIWPKIYSGIFKAKKVIAPSFPEKDSEEMINFRKRGRSPRTPSPRNVRQFPNNLSTRVRKLLAAQKALYKVHGRTPAKKGRTVKFRGASASRSAGKFRRGKRINRRGYRQRSVNKGLVRVFEHGGVVTSNYCRYIGHHDSPYYDVMYLLWCGILKKLLEKTGYRISADAAPLENIIIGDIIQVEYRTGPSFVTAITTRALLAGDSLKTLAEYFVDKFDSTEHGLFGNNLMFHVIKYIPQAVGYTTMQMNMENLKVHLTSKSTLKIQNRSKNALGSEADEVDNVPLYGKSYTGKGSGMEVDHQKPYVTSMFYADVQKGMILYDGLNEYREPILAQNTRNTSYSSKVKLDPSDIKTSALSSSTTMLLNKFITKMALSTGSVASTSSIKTLVGKFRVFALEKMIETETNEADIVPITVAYEVNTRISCYVTGGANATLQSFIVKT